MERAMNELHRYIGDSHPRAVLTNDEVDRLVAMREAEGLSYNRLAEIFGISKSSVRDYLVGRRRCQAPVRWKARSLACA